MKKKMYDIQYKDISNFCTDYFDKILIEYGTRGYQSVSCLTYNNEYNIQVMRLIFQKEISNE